MLVLTAHSEASTASGHLQGHCTVNTKITIKDHIILGDEGQYLYSDALSSSGRAFLIIEIDLFRVYILDQFIPRTLANRTRIESYIY